MYQERIKSISLRGLDSEQRELIGNLPWQFPGDHVDLRSKYGHWTVRLTYRLCARPMFLPEVFYILSATNAR